MPALALWIGSVASAILAWLAEVVTKRVAIIVAAVAALVVVNAAFIAAINSALGALSVAYPTGWVAVGLGLLPGNVDECVSVAVSAHVAAWAYQWKVRFIDQRARI